VTIHLIKRSCLSYQASDVEESWEDIQDCQRALLILNQCLLNNLSTRLSLESISHHLKDKESKRKISNYIHHHYHHHVQQQNHSLTAQYLCVWYLITNTTFADSRSPWVLFPPFVRTITVASDESEDTSREPPDPDTIELSDMGDSNKVYERSCWSTTVNRFKNVYKYIKEKIISSQQYLLLTIHSLQVWVSPAAISVATLTVRFPACKSSSNTSASTSVPDSSVKCSSVSSGRSSFWMTNKNIRFRAMEKLQ